MRIIFWELGKVDLEKIAFFDWVKLILFSLPSLYIRDISVFVLLQLSKNKFKFWRKLC
jgi:hypothetical protein